MTPVFSTTDLVVRYGDRPALDGVTIDIPAGAVTAIVGSNGCGKSTLLRALGRVGGPIASGSVRFEGRPVDRIPPREFARRVALLPQAPVAPERLSVVDLVSRGRDPHRRWYDQWSRADEEVVLESLTRTGLRDLAERPVESLSGGQRQRAWIAMALAQRTPVLLLDEPTTYLDVAHQLEVLETLRGLHDDDGVTIVMVLHDLTLAARFADHIVALRDGAVAAAGDVSRVLTPVLLDEVFDVDSVLLDDPRTQRPIVVPYTKRGGGPLQPGTG